VNEHGLLIGLTNQRTYAPADVTKRSRGEVVLGTLHARTVGEAVERLAKLVPDEFNAFNLLIGDGETLLAAYSRAGQAQLEFEFVPEGVHVLPNDRLGARGFPKADRAAELAGGCVGLPWPKLVPALGAILGDHALPALSEVPVPPVGSAFDHAAARRAEAICLHGAHYGTCSSSLVGMREREVVHYLHAQGAPCVTPFVEVTSALR
jgi:uncharacterized protein with NRDE domain